MPGEYPPNWTEIATAVKDDADWKCIRCGEIHDPEKGYCLTVHHLDGDKSNCIWWNLAALCQRCHLSIQNRVRMDQFYMFEHTDWFKPYVAGFYAFHNGVNDDRDFVLAHLDELLELGGQ